MKKLFVLLLFLFFTIPSYAKDIAFYDWNSNIQGYLTDEPCYQSVINVLKERGIEENPAAMEQMAQLRAFRVIKFWEQGSREACYMPKEDGSHFVIDQFGSSGFLNEDFIKEHI